MEPDLGSGQPREIVQARDGLVHRAVVVMPLVEVSAAGSTARWPNTALSAGYTFYATQVQDAKGYFPVLAYSPRGR